ncbi:MAG: hypothetical protein ACPGGK_08725 [Pikeienuella sp.]
MKYESLDILLSKAQGSLKGPLALVICESAFLAVETTDWLSKCGFRTIIAVGAVGDVFEQSETVMAAPANFATPDRQAKIANSVSNAVAGQWMLVCFSGEFIFYPHIETRCIADFTDFLAAERRTSASSYAIDIYSDALGRDDEAFDLEEVYFDSQGWYGFEREGRQADIYGGLGWRFEEYTLRNMFRINRPALFVGGATLREDLWLTEEEGNTLSCPWHHNPTFALMSVRRARALRAHPKFSQGVPTFMWPNSERFEWKSEQLLSHGLIEQGQWL